MEEKDQNTTESFEGFTKINRFNCECFNCKSKLTLDADEIIKETFQCPDCNSLNRIQNINEYKGIKGWLSLFAISLIFGIFTRISNLKMIADSFDLFNKYPAFDYQPYYLSFLIANSIFYFIFLISTITFFAKLRIAPKLIILYLLVYPLITMFNQWISYLAFQEFIIVYSLNEEVELFDSIIMNVIVINFLYSMIWILYFRKSIRVKLTFTKSIKKLGQMPKLLIARITLFFKFISQYIRKLRNYATKYKDKENNVSQERDINKFKNKTTHNNFFQGKTFLMKIILIVLLSIGIIFSFLLSYYLITRNKIQLSFDSKNEASNINTQENKLKFDDYRGDIHFNSKWEEDRIYYKIILMGKYFPKIGKTKILSRR